MSDYRLLGTHRTWEDWCGMLLGVLIVLSPWFPTQTSHDAVDADRSFMVLNTFTVGILGNLFSRVGSGGMPYLIPLMLQVALGYSPVQAGMMMIPAALARPDGVTSLGCIGNRVYTELGDDELYFTIPGSRVGEVVERLETVLHANRELERYHQGRRAAL